MNLNCSKLVFKNPDKNGVLSTEELAAVSYKAINDVFKLINRATTMGSHLTDQTLAKIIQKNLDKSKDVVKITREDYFGLHSVYFEKLLDFKKSNKHGLFIDDEGVIFYRGITGDIDLKDLGPGNDNDVITINPMKFAGWIVMKSLNLADTYPNIFSLNNKAFPTRQNPHKKLSEPAQKRVSKKIRKLMNEGYGQKQAAAIAYNMERKHKIGPKGGKRKNPKKQSSGFSTFRRFRKEDFTFMYYTPYRREPIKIIKVEESKDKFNQNIYAVTFEKENGHIETLSELLKIKNGYASQDGSRKAIVKRKFKRRNNRRRRHGQIKNPIADKDVYECLAALAGMIQVPDRCEDVNEDILKALESEGLWSYDTGVTDKGRKFLSDSGWDIADEFYD